MNYNFVSIPRCASQSTFEALGISKYMNHKSIKLFPHPELPGIAIIRDPVDHARSWYSFHRYKLLTTKYYTMEFDEWVTKGFPTHWTPDECKIMGITHPLEQWDYVTINGRIAIDNLLNFGDLERELKQVCVKLQIKMEPLRVTSRSKFIDVGQNQARIIRERFKKSFELWGKVENGQGDSLRAFRK